MVASEVIEHVDNVERFAACLGLATRPGGAAVLSTLNRTPRAWVLAIVAAEHVLRWAPPGENLLAPIPPPA